MEFEGEGYKALKMDDSLISIESSIRVHDLRLPRRDADLFLTCSSSIAFSFFTSVNSTASRQQLSWGTTITLSASARWHYALTVHTFVDNF